MQKTSVGFVGLGDMGKRLAKNLVGDAFDPWMYDVAEAPLAELVALGARAAKPAGIARACGLIGICVRDDKDVESLLYGEHAMLANAREDTIFAIHSTVTQRGLQRWAADAAARGVHVIDAPVTQGSGGMEPKFVCYMVGGDAALLERCRPMLDPSAESIIHAGALGAGMALKLCNNLITYLEFIAMAEALALAQGCGLSAEVLRELGKSNGVINERMYRFATNRSNLSQQLDEATFHKAFGGFATLAVKDLEAALQSANDVGAVLPATRYAQGVIESVFLNKPY